MDAHSFDRLGSRRSIMIVMSLLVMLGHRFDTGILHIDRNEKRKITQQYQYSHCGSPECNYAQGREALAAVEGDPKYHQQRGTATQVQSTKTLPFHAKSLNYQNSISRSPTALPELYPLHLSSNRLQK
ncbi:unnamed protein product [Fusarium graminearum]|nr:unnamed protein product [Fusarium graminearum]VTO85046.1 unnamed protein product [Fusarium graminearum]